VALEREAVGLLGLQPASAHAMTPREVYLARRASEHQMERVAWQVMHAYAAMGADPAPTVAQLLGRQGTPKDPGFVSRSEWEAIPDVVTDAAADAGAD
jgi:hypothetical protein